MLNGDAQFTGVTGVTPVMGSFAGSFLTTDSTGAPYLYQNGILQNGQYYSAAGTPLPTCNSGLISGGFGVNLLGSGMPTPGSGVRRRTFTAPVYCG